MEHIKQSGERGEKVFPNPAVFLSRLIFLLSGGQICKSLYHKGAVGVLPHLQGNIEIGRHKDRNAEVGNTKHRIYRN